MSYKDLEKKIIKLDPLAEGLSNVGFEGGAGKLTTKKTLKILRDHGHKSKVKGDKIKTAYSEGSGGKFKTKIKTLPKEFENKKQPYLDRLNLLILYQLDCRHFPRK